jgi:hypothetical protein
MGLFKSLKGNRLDHVGQDFAIDHDAYQPPPGPPPSHLPEAEKFTPPDDFQPPPGPPPFQVPADNPPPYHDWTSIPDTSLLPPPPSLGHKSSSNNATWDDAARAHTFCDLFPPYLPAQPPAVVQEAVRRGHVALERPTEYAGELKPVTSRLPGLWSARSRRGCGDCVFLSNLVSNNDCQQPQCPPSPLFPSYELTNTNLPVAIDSPYIWLPPTRPSTPTSRKPSISKCASSVWVGATTASQSVIAPSPIQAGVSLDGNEPAWACTETMEGGLSMTPGVERISLPISSKEKRSALAWSLVCRLQAQAQVQVGRCRFFLRPFGDFGVLS